MSKAKKTPTTLAPWERGKLEAGDVPYEISYVWHLLDVTAESLSEMDFVRDGKRDKNLDRLDALVRLARDHVKRIEIAFDNGLDGLGTPSTLAPLILPDENARKLQGKLRTVGEKVGLIELAATVEVFTDDYHQHCIATGLDEVRTAIYDVLEFWDEGGSPEGQS